MNLITCEFIAPKAFGDRMRELFVKEWGEGGAPFWSTNQATKAKIKADTARFMSQARRF